MLFRRSILSLAILFIGVNALPAPPQTDASTSVAAAESTGATTATTAATTSQRGKQATSSSDVVTSEVSPTPIVDSPTPLSTQSTPTTTAQAETTPSTVLPSTTEVVVPVTTSSAAPSTLVTSTQPSVTVVSHSPTPVSTNLPSVTTADTTSHTAHSQTASSSSTSSSTTSADASQSTQSSGGTNTKTILIIGGTVGGLVIAAFIAFSIFRKLKLKPSRAFEERMEPAAGYLEEWNDPRTFRGYTQNASSANSLQRSNSVASSKYSFDEMDEKAGGGAAVLARGNTIRHFGQEKVYPSETGDGLREAGRGYRGF